MAKLTRIVSKGSKLPLCDKCWFNYKSPRCHYCGNEKIYDTFIFNRKDSLHHNICKGCSE